MEVGQLASVKNETPLRGKGIITKQEGVTGRKGIKAIRRKNINAETGSRLLPDLPPAGHVKVSYGRQTTHVALCARVSSEKQAEKELSIIIEERSFLKSFIERIEVDESQVKMYYTIPMPPYNVSVKAVGVLLFVHNGSSRWNKGGEVDN
ncbi:MAG TPA: hypothetical protein G4N93_06910 [Dehalococcoidia bacterium]|nr:hypothetical protein [Dehalococcoidia bacterium]